MDINKIIEENHNLKMQLATEKLKNNNAFNAEKSESHNDEEYEEIIAGLKKKIEDKDNKINELQKMIDSDNASDNSFKNKSKDKMNNSIIEMEKIKGNYQENISTIQDLYENMLIEKENKIKELANEVNIIEKELEDLNDKYDKEKKNVKLNTIKINELENEKISLLEQINTFKNKEQDHKKSIEILKNENKKIKIELNKNIDTNLNINDMKNYISNYQNDNINDNNFNSASNRQINKQKEELRLLKKKFKEILDDNNKLTNEVNDYNMNQIKEKEEFTEMMRNTFTKFLKASKIDNKNKDYAIIVLKLLGYNENDIKDIFKSQKKGTIFGMFQ
jgi:chromosome segregation ATPase